ncbi:MAG TPA: hypothetical protein VFT77_10205 [Reyranella sp.]|jgi:hypothetical protein|nr:hypothetical protein [Reyranella sp.]
MRLLLAIALSLLLAACSGTGPDFSSHGPSFDPSKDDVADLLIVFDLPRGLGTNNTAGQLFTFDAAQGGPNEHLRLTLMPADGDQVMSSLPPPADGRSYYLFQLAPQAKSQILAAQQSAQARGVPGSSIQLGIVPHLCSSGPVDQNAATVTISAVLPGKTGLLPFINNEPLAQVLQLPGSNQLGICS